MITVEKIKGRSISQQRIEIVERKGKGHPDFICDAVMEAISVALSSAYLTYCGDILHHNIDKGLLAAGSTQKTFGGGRMLKPMQLIIGDRATFAFQDRKIPVKDIAIETAKRWFRENLRFVNPIEDVRYQVMLAEGSEELTDIFSRPGGILGANDTSAAVGYYPLSVTEEIILELEHYLNSPSFKTAYPETGEDIKVMGLRNAYNLDIIVCMPLISRYIGSVAQYFDQKAIILQDIQHFVAESAGKDFRKIRIHYNTLDRKDRGIGGLYLSLLGTSAEDADSGQVGRGNRVNGLISMNRPMGTEAAAGKNSVSHVGKIYNLLSHHIAKEIHENVTGVEDVYVLLLSEIGRPVNQPKMASAQVLLAKGQTLKNVKKPISDLFNDTFENIQSFLMKLAEGKYSVC